MILGAAIPALALAQPVNLCLMGTELCEECPWLAFDFSAGLRKNSLRFSRRANAGWLSFAEQKEVEAKVNRAGSRDRDQL